MSKIVKSPLRWAGGKQRAVNHILSKFPKEPINRYIEPFFGGGCLGLNAKARGLAKSYTFNDIDYHLWNFWDKVSLSSTNKKMTNSLGFTHEEETSQKSKKDLYYEVKELLLDYNVVINTPEWINAARYFFVNRCSFSAGGLLAGFSGERFTLNSIKRLAEIQPYLVDCQITCKDYKDLFFEYLYGSASDQDFMYIDSPYEGIDNLYACIKVDHKNKKITTGCEEFNHELLCANLNKLPCKVLISYNDTPTIRSLYSTNGWVIESYDLIYGMSKNKLGKEILIRNYLI